MGQVTSEPAGVRMVHPVIDEFGDSFGVFASGSSTIRATAPFQLFLAESGDMGLVPVLLTRLDAAVSAHASLAMRRAGGVWAAQGPDSETFDAMSGYRITRFEELGTVVGGDRDRLDTFTDTDTEPRDGVPVLMFDLTVFHRITPRLRVGVSAEVMVDGLGGGALDWWDSSEPLLKSWSIEQVTELVRSQMPTSERVLAGSRSGAFVEIEAARVLTGVMEHVAGGVPLPARNPRHSDLLSMAAGALEKVARAGDVQVGIVSVGEFDPGSGTLVQSVRARRLEQPLAVVLGPGPIDEFEIEVADLMDGFDAHLVGDREEPGLLVVLADGQDQWEQMAGLWGRIGIEKVAHLAGIQAEETGGE